MWMPLQSKTECNTLVLILPNVEIGFKFIYFVIITSNSDIQLSTYNPTSSVTSHTKLNALKQYNDVKLIFAQSVYTQ